ncbi:MAG: NUDIX hydrolase [Chlorobiaceae bacterium]|nr:NUDIX hydrolase [Chlorobiaceae bacterium]
MAGRTIGVMKQSGVLPLMEDRVVLITAKKSENWVIPKGYIEKGLSPAESAAKEAFEEAGLIGRVHHEIAGKYSYSKYGKLFSVSLYPLYIEKMLDKWDEMRDRRRVIVTPAEAIEMVAHENLRRILADFFRPGH